MKIVTVPISRLYVIVALLSVAGAMHASGRPWGYQDMIAVRYIAPDPSSPNTRISDTAHPESAAFSFSPDGNMFFFATSWGELESDVKVNELLVYQTQNVLERLSSCGATRPRYIAPDWVVTRRSYNMTSPIDDVSWDDDGRSLVFTGSGRDDSIEAFRLDLSMGTLVQASLSDKSGDVVWVVARGEGTLYARGGKGEPGPAVYPAEWVKHRSNGAFMTADVEAALSRANLFATMSGRLPRAISLDDESVFSSRDVWLSVDGCLALARSARSRLISIDLKRAYSEIIKGVELGVAGAYQDGTSRKPAPKVFWFEDTYAIILNGRIVEVSGGESSAAAQPLAGSGGFLLEYDSTSRKVRTLAPMVETSGSIQKYLVGAEWRVPGRQLLVRYRSAGNRDLAYVYSLGTAGVERHEATLAETSGRSQPPKRELQLKLLQSANEAPRVMASDGKWEAMLTLPDPALLSPQIARTEAFSWREPDGHTVAGGLTLPPGFVKGDRVPLVIQAYYNRPGLFLPDGHGDSSDAAQTLAARGFAVLQIDIPLPHMAVLGTLAYKSEGAAIVARVDAAVEALASEGIVDPARVGMTGFSRGGYETFYVLTHPGNVRLAAAMGADFFTGSFHEYVLSGASYSRGALAEAFERSQGGSFWEKRPEWLAYDPVFNVDRATGPLLVSVHSVSFDLAVRSDKQAPLGVIGAFLRNDKPVEYQRIAYGGHHLTRPREQIASVEGMVDWMSFWLQGYEDPAPHKMKQYQRWRPMREQQARSLARTQTVQSGSGQR